MTQISRDGRLAIAPIFVPATRPDRFAKAAQSGADAIIVDLEDAVAAADKDAARDALAQADLPPVARILRINAAGTSWHEKDLAAAAQLAFDAVMLPKSEMEGDIAFVRAAIGPGKPIIALVETALGVAQAATLARCEGVERLAFGSVDFCADLGCANEWDALLHARSTIVLASRLGGIAAPIDGVTLELKDDAKARDDARRASALGFSGKLCIHPRQVGPVLEGFAPTAEEIDWAQRVASVGDQGAVSIDGLMVDPPVLRRAEQILARARAMIKNS
ncbi:citrate lyase subunit beta / citryl-CoA lyase [Sphingobium faniae]|nr:citrate lyase subunit beta / citryl-CoA lyase [Sphingobium faniae]